MSSSGQARTVLVLVVALALAGCGAPETDTPAPPTTTALTVERERSDRFWSRAIDYEPRAFELSTLEDVVAESELIVRGRIGGQRMVGCSDPNQPAGPPLCEERDRSFVIVAVDEVIKSSGPYTGGALLVRVDFGAIPDAELPRGELVLFLKNYGRSYVESGHAEPADSPRWAWWFMTTTFQGALRNLDGLVDVPEAPEGWWEDHGPFPGDMDGQPFDRVVTRIRELLGG